MQRKVLWTAAIAFSAFSATGLTAEGDSPRWEATQQKEAPGGSPPPGGEMQDSSTDALPSFSQADANNNGLIDPSEASDVGLDFSGADRNSDGDLQFDEYQTATGQSGR